MKNRNMPKDSQCAIRFLPFEITVSVSPGTNLMDAVKQAGLPLKASCGGEGICGDCLLLVREGRYQAKSSSALSEDLLSQGYVLACLAEVESDITVQLPQFEELSIRSITDSTFFHEHRDDISGYFEAGSVPKAIAELVPHTGKDIYGLACDVGTTTVVVQLVDLKSGNIVNTASGYNHQLKCGEDIISRINYSQKPGKLQELNNLILTTVNNLIQKNLEGLRISLTDIYYASISGNTTMTYLLRNLNPRHIRENAFVPELTQTILADSRDVGLSINPGAKVVFAPAVGSYVGGDITAGLLCTPIFRDSEAVSLFVDVGTNGELVIGNRDWMVTCACSAGPAFEGTGTKCGMPAAEGAIERLRLKNGKAEYEVIGNGKPRGLCGSGLVDLLAELFIHGYIDRGGKLREGAAGLRIIETNRGKGFRIVQGADSYWSRDLIITENDIANLIRTKGAVFSACSLMLKNIGLSLEAIDAVYIAGGFGRYLNIENAIRIGLFPDLDRAKFHYLGNSSLHGSYLVLLSDKNEALVNEIAKRMTYIELNTEPDYMREYTGSLFLPHTDIDLFPSVKRIVRS